MNNADPSPKAEVFERALKSVLRPMMRMLISKGIAAPAFYRLVKQTFVRNGCGNDGARRDRTVGLVS